MASLATPTIYDVLNCSNLGSVKRIILTYIEGKSRNVLRNATVNRMHASEDSACAHRKTRKHRRVYLKWQGGRDKLSVFRYNDITSRCRHTLRVKSGLYVSYKTVFAKLANTS